MNKVIPTSERIFMCVCGSSGSGKTELIRSMLTRPKLQNGSGGGIFQPNFDHIVYVYRYWQTVYDKIRQDLRETSNQTILHFFCVVNQQQQQIPTKNVFHQPPPKVTNTKTRMLLTVLFNLSSASKNLGHRSVC